jgi:hypothetical protein
MLASCAIQATMIGAPSPSPIVVAALYGEFGAHSVTNRYSSSQNDFCSSHPSPFFSSFYPGTYPSLRFFCTQYPKRTRNLKNESA